MIASKPKYNISSQIDSKDRDEKRKSKLKEIREKYGITSSQEIEVGSNYKDRADERRKTKGSDHGNFFLLFKRSLSKAELRFKKSLLVIMFKVFPNLMKLLSLNESQ